jgi:hypothetical protein
LIEDKGAILPQIGLKRIMPIGWCDFACLASKLAAYSCWAWAMSRLRWRSWRRLKSVEAMTTSVTTTMVTVARALMLGFKPKRAREKITMGMVE